jgi:hypothetical protein
MMKRWKLSDAQRADMWNRWKAGQSLHAIGRALGKDHVVIRFLFVRLTRYTKGLSAFHPYRILATFFPG